MREKIANSLNTEEAECLKVLTFEVRKGSYAFQCFVPLKYDLNNRYLVHKSDLYPYTSHTDESNAQVAPSQYSISSLNPH